MNTMQLILKKEWVFFLLLCFTDRVYSQENGAIEGRVKDGQNHFLRAVAVRLVDQYDLMAPKTVQTDTAGRFYIDEIPFGMYNCVVTQAGTRPIKVDSIPVTPHCGTINLGDLVLLPGNYISTIIDGHPDIF
jgi:hypothetical protein